MKDVFDYFKIHRNDDAKRFEFQSLTNKITSYTISFEEANNIVDAKIAVWKALNIEAQKQERRIQDFIQNLADSGIA